MQPDHEPEPVIDMLVEEIAALASLGLFITAVLLWAGIIGGSI